MQVGIDSYSYHRRYGESRAGEAPSSHEPWPLEPGPVLRHARAIGAARSSSRPATCRRPRPSTPRRSPTLAPPDVRFSWGHPWPERPVPRAGWRPLPRRRDRAGALDRDGGAARSRRPAHHRRQPGVARRRARRGPRRAARGARPVAPPTAPPGPASASPSRTTATCGSPTSSSCSSGSTGRRRSASASTTSISSGSATTWPRAPRRSRRTRCSSSSRTTWPATRRCWGGPVCTALGEGVADLDGLIAILVAAGFDGPVCVELASLGRGRRR